MSVMVNVGSIKKFFFDVDLEGFEECVFFVIRFKIFVDFF